VILMAWINVDRDRIAPVDDPHQNPARHDASPAPPRHRQRVPLVPAEKQLSGHPADNSPIGENPNPQHPFAFSPIATSALSCEWPHNRAPPLQRPAARDSQVTTK
jgi:hypothetical protein